MNYNVKGTGVQVTPELRSYVESQFARQADKFLKDDSAARASVEFEYSPLRDGAQYRCELSISSSGGNYRAETWGGTLHEAIDLSVGELTHELRRAKDRRIHIWRRGAARIKGYLRGWRDRP